MSSSLSSSYFSKSFFAVVSIVGIWSVGIFSTSAFKGETPSYVSSLERLEIFSESEKLENFYGYRSITREDFIMWNVKAQGTDIDINTEDFIPSYPFLDIPENSEFSAALELAFLSGALNPYTYNQNFFPHKKLTRSEAIKIFFTLHGISPLHDNLIGGSSKWENLPTDPVEKAYIIAALEYGYLDPIDKTNTAYNQKISRSEAAKMIWELQSNNAPTITLTPIETENNTTNSDIDRVLSYIEDRYKYNDQLEENQLSDAAINAIVESLDDPYSQYLPPEASEAFTDSVTKNTLGEQEKYGGIGTAITPANEGGIIVTEIFNQSPAGKTSLQVGDRITEVNGENIESISVTEAAEKIKGPIETNVTLTVERNGNMLSINIIRGTVDLTGYSSVNAHVQENILWIRVRSFKSFSAQEFTDALEQNMTDDIQGIIVDVRYNSGGIMSIAQSMLGNLLPEGYTALRFYTNTDEDILEVLGDGTYSDIPLVVFQNEYSASASEIFAAALKDYERATIIGKKSYGKGVAQVLFDLERGSLKLTTAEFTSPLQNTIHRTGVEPDIFMENESDSAYFTQALKIFSQE